MLTQPTLEKLQTLKLLGMVKGLEEQLQMTGLEEIGFVERLGLLVDREITDREVDDSRIVSPRRAYVTRRRSKTSTSRAHAAWIGLFS
jgi:hypothetical protein